MFAVAAFASGSTTLCAVEPKPSQTHTVLAIEQDRFTINGEPTFLMGISYYAGLGASDETLNRDLDAIQQGGFNWLRVWATWDSIGENVSAFDSSGNQRQPYFERLKSLVAECDRRGMIVDVTLARSSDDDSVHLRDLEAHRRAVRFVIDALKSHDNWYLDLANERDVGDDRFVSVDELKELRQLARTLDPSLAVTASFGGHDLTKSDVRDPLESAGCDFLAVHRPRHAGSPGETEGETRKLLDIEKEMNRVAPILHQEPFRRGYTDWQPTAEDFLTDLRGAIAGGAAGWCFHNGSTRGVDDEKPRRSFDLREKPLIDQLDGEEQKVLQRAKEVLTAN
jgi:hypothetical protein